MAQVKLALVGKPGTGQMRAAVYLKSRYKFKRKKLMDGARRVSLTMYGVRRIERHIPYKIYNLMYKFEPDIWLKYLRYRLARSNVNVVVEDVRYVSEANALKKEGFIIIRISTDKKTAALEKDLAPNSIAATEYSFDPTVKVQADYSIHWTDVDHLYRLLDALMEKLDIPKQYPYD